MDATETAIIPNIVNPEGFCTRACPPADQANAIAHCMECFFNHNRAPSGRVECAHCHPGKLMKAEGLQCNCKD